MKLWAVKGYSKVGRRVTSIIRSDARPSQKGVVSEVVTTKSLPGQRLVGTYMENSGPLDLYEPVHEVAFSGELELVNE